MPGQQTEERRSESIGWVFRPPARGGQAAPGKSQGLETLEPRLLLSATLPGQALAEPLSASSGEVTAAVGGGDVVYQEQTQYDNFFKPNVIAFDFAVDPGAVGGRIDLTALSDLNGLSETVAYDLEGIVSGELFTAPDDGVRPFTATINLSNADLAALAADGNLHIEFTPSDGVDDFHDVDEYVTVGLTYDFAPLVEGYSYTVSPEAEWVDVTFVIQFSEPVFGSLLGTGHHTHVSTGLENEFVSSEYDASTRELTVTYKNYAEGNYYFYLDPETTQSAIRDASGNLLGLDPAVMLVTPVGELAAEFTIEHAPVIQVGQFAEQTGLDASFAYLVTEEAYKLKGEFDYTGDVDRYAIDLRESLLLTMVFNDLSGSGLMTEVTLYNPSGEVIAYENAGRPIFNGVKINDPGTHIVEVSNSAVVYNPIAYNASISINYSYEDGWFGQSTNDSLETAQDLDGLFFEIDSVIEQTSINGALQPDEASNDPDRDYYKLSLMAGESVSLTLAGGPRVNKMRLLDPNGITMVEGYDPAYSVAAGISSFIAPETGTYYIEIEKLISIYTGIYTLVVTKGAAFGHALPSYFRPHRLSPQGLAVGDVDSDPGYTFQVQAGDSLDLWTLTPDFSPPSYPNSLQTQIKLYGPDGALVGESATGDQVANARLQHTAEASGTYTVHIEALYGSGPYVLHVEGGTGEDPPFYVQVDNLVDEELLDRSINQLRVFIDDFVRTDTLEAQDLTVNGLPCSAVEWESYNTYVFDLPPGLGDGSYHFEIAEGAILNTLNQPIEPFSLNVTVDTTGPRIVSSSIQEGDVLEPGQQSLTLRFDEPLDETELSTYSIGIDGVPGPARYVRVDGYTYDPATYELTFDFEATPEGHYTITTGTSIKDLAGNLLDGEAPQGTLPPEVTGEGEPGGAYVLAFDVDRSEVETVSTFRPVAPIHTLGATAGPVEGYVNHPDDTDTYRVNLQSGQMMTVVVEPVAGYESYLTLGGFGAQFTADGPGEPIVWTYRVQGPDSQINLIVGADIATEYNLTVYLNAVSELGLSAAPSTGRPVYDLAGAWIDLGRGAASVATVFGQGQTDQASATIYDIAAPGPYTFDFNDMSPPTGDGTLTITTRSDLDHTSEYLSVGGEGFSFGDVFVNDGSSYTQTTALTIPFADLQAMAADGTITFDVTPSPGVNEINWGNHLKLAIAYPGMPDRAQDAYAVDLAEGQVFSVMLNSEEDTYGLELANAQTGEVVALGVPGSFARLQTIEFTAPAAGRYDVRVHTEAGSSYTLAALRDSIFDLQHNYNTYTNEPAQSLDASGRVLGHLEVPRPDRLFALESPSPVFPGYSAYELDPLTLEPIREFQLEGGVYAADLAYDGINLYARSSQNGPVWMLDPDTGALRHKIDYVNSSPFGSFASYGGQLVLRAGSLNQLWFFDPYDGAVERELELAVEPSITFRGLVGAEPRDSLFASYREYVPDADYLTRVVEIDAATGQTLNSFTIEQADVSSLAYVSDQLYAYSIYTGELGIYDPANGQLVSMSELPGSRIGWIAGDGVVPRDVPDRYTLDLKSGQQVTLSIGTPFDAPGRAGSNSLDPAIRVLDPNGVEVAFDDNGAADGKNAMLAFTAVAGGIYIVEVSAVDGAGEYLLNVDRAPFLFGDLTGDGFVGIEDMNVVLGNWNRSVPVGSLAQGDASGDGFVGIEDLNAVQRNWNAILPDPVVEGDLTGDGFVGVEDLNLVLGNWNTDGTADTRSDPTGDGFVGIEDLNLVLSDWNAGTPPSSEEAVVLLQQAAGVEPVALSVSTEQAQPVAQQVNVVVASVVDKPVSTKVEPRRAGQHQRSTSPERVNQSALAAWGERRDTGHGFGRGTHLTAWSLGHESSTTLLGLWDDTDDFKDTYGGPA
jgi:Big-like domain-containing protein/pre-peptidase